MASIGLETPEPLANSVLRVAEEAEEEVPVAVITAPLEPTATEQGVAGEPVVESHHPNPDQVEVPAAAVLASLFWGPAMWNCSSLPSSVEMPVTEEMVVHRDRVSREALAVPEETVPQGLPMLDAVVTEAMGVPAVVAAVVAGDKAMLRGVTVRSSLLTTPS